MNIAHPTGRTVVLALLALATALSARPSTAADVSISASVGRSQLYLGESVLLTVRVSGTDDPSEQPDVSALSGMSARPLGSQSASRHSVTIINGRVSREDFEGREYAYDVTPSAAGTFRLGPIRMNVKGRAVSHPGPQITVVGVETQDVVSVQVEASRTALLMEEAFDITLTVRVRSLPPPHTEYQPFDPNNPPQLRIPYLEAELPGLQTPDLRTVLQGLLTNPGQQAGFRINDFTIRSDPFGNMFNFNFSVNSFQPAPALFALTPRQVDVGGRRFWEYRLTTHYVPKDEREHTFGPVQFKGPVLTGVTAQGTPTVRDVFAVGPAVTVRVVPPPEEGRPDTYAGVLGTNMALEASLDTQTCNVGDPLRLTLAVSGDVNLDRLRLPPVWERPQLAALFRAYPDTLQTRRESGRVEYSVTLRPTLAGTLEVPPIALSFFNTATRQYVEVRSRPIPLQVNESTVLTPEHVISLGTNTTASASVGGERRQPPAPITVSPEGTSRQSLLGGAPQLAVAGAGVAVFILTGAWVLVAAVVHRRSATARSRKALRRALRRLSAARAGGSQAAFGEVSQVLRQYVSDRDPAAPEGLTPSDCRRRLADAGVDAPVVERFHSLLTRMFEGGFSAGGTAIAERADIDEAADVLHGLDRAWHEADRARGRT